MQTKAWTAVAALSLFSLTACGGGRDERAGDAINNAHGAVAGAADNAGDAIGNAGRALTPTPSGQEFADMAAKSDAFEIEAAKLAQTNAESPQVKAFAKMMITAHTEATAKIKAAAAEASPAITPNATLTADQNEHLTELRGLKGAAFDKEYIDEQVDAHEDALELMRKYAADGTVPSLKKAAGEIAPVVEKHLASARALDRD